MLATCFGIPRPFLFDAVGMKIKQEKKEAAETCTDDMDALLATSMKLTGFDGLADHLTHLIPFLSHCHSSVNKALMIVYFSIRLYLFF